jgi:NADPH:quinone reductase
LKTAPSVPLLDRHAMVRHMPSTMRVFGASQIGPIELCHIVEVPLPEPGPGQVRVKVRSAALNPADAKTILGKTGMLHAKAFPLVMGYDVSGVVDALGSGVTDLTVGTEVFGMLAYSRRTRLGSLAEYTVVPAHWLARKPAAIDHDTAAAAATAGLTALQGLRGPGRMRGGDRVLVTGASGGVGALVLGVAKSLGGSADAITSTAGIELVKSLGAGTVVDRNAPDALAALKGRYQIVYDAAAAYSMRSFRNVLGKGGTYITTLPKPTIVGDLIASLFLRRRTRLVMVKPSRPDLETLADFIQRGLQVPIAKKVRLEDVGAALADYDKNGAKGKIVVRIAD